MFVDDLREDVMNFEHLFNMTAPDGVSDPLESSLFNIDTLTELLTLSKKVPDIIDDEK